ncbi:hypothetical protein KSS87_001854 [Heliosperma pusillum]|nr:hypothetical protein KSS87_001854 [Heliosperma pusillum]
MSVTAGVSDAIIAVREKLRGKIGQTKVKRYWPGKAPDWADEVEEDADLHTSSTSNRVSIDKAFPSDDINSVDDPRLRRLATTRTVDRDEIRADHRRIRQAEIVSTAAEDEAMEDAAAAEEDDEDAVEEKRRGIRERLLNLRREEERELPTVEEDEEDEDEDEDDEDESEYETDSDDEEDANRRAMAKPVFVPKQERETIAEREKIEADERALEESVKRRIAERKAETKQIVVEKIREDYEIQKSLVEYEADIGDVDTDDEANEAEEYESWKAREIARIKRDREDRDTMIKEKEEIEKVRNMTEEERREWERKNPKSGGTVSVPKQKWTFMQKYYHKGAYFQDDPDDSAGTMGSHEIYRRDFSAPTGDDKLNKTILPKVMQVKHFGRSGRTKWTHLVNEDTTDWTTPYVAFSSFWFSS